MNIEYSEDNYTVVLEKNFESGNFRIIYYDTHYYALQHKIIFNIAGDKDTWKTVCISPEKDNVFEKNRDWKLNLGYMDMKLLLQFIEDSFKLHNNGLCELHLNLNPNLNSEISDEIVYLINSSDEKEIKNRVIKSIQLQDKYIRSQTKKASSVYTILLLIGLIIAALIFLKQIGVGC